MAFPYKIHQEAHEEYIQAYEWYEIKQNGLGDKFMHAVEKRLQQISEHPEYYGILPGKFRQVKIEGFPFIIAYEFFKKRKLIHIASIYHVKRNPRKKYRREQ
jgi:hypothetical protein